MYNLGSVAMVCGYIAKNQFKVKKRLNETNIWIWDYFNTLDKDKLQIHQTGDVQQSTAQSFTLRLTAASVLMNHQPNCLATAYMTRLIYSLPQWDCGLKPWI